MKPWMRVSVVAVAGTLVSLGVALQVRRAEEDAVRRQVAEEATQASERVGFDLAVRVDTLQRLARHWIAAGGFDRAEWEDDATQLLSAVAGFRAVAWADADGIVRYAVARDMAPPPIGSDLGAVPQTKAGLVGTRASGEPDVVAPVTLAPGATGIVALVPLPMQGRFDGWIVGSFPVDDLVTEAHGFLPSYRVALRHADAVVYDSGGDWVPRYCEATPLTPIDPSVTLDVCAQRALVEESEDPLPALTFLAGLGSTALATGLAASLQASRRQGAEAARLAADVVTHARALERANRELADLSYSVSHELRTPLRAIDGHAALLAEHAAPADIPALARIRVNAQRMARQVDGLVELMRLVRTPPRPRPVDVSELAHACCEAMAAAEPGRRVELRVEDGLIVDADPEFVRVILSALLDNAFKFTRGRSPARIEVGAHPGGFFVRDNGVGFDMAYAGKLFRTFETLHGRGEFEGLGLGLATAGRAAASHGGDIRAESRPGEGATFWVTLPPPV